MHVRPSTQAIASPNDVTDRAQRAVVAFRHMQHGLTSYARAITGSRKVRVEVSSGTPRTDGNIIYYRPPIALGDKTPHDRMLCDRREDNGLKSCPACRIREEVLVNIYHEIAHIAFGSFADGTNYMQVAARYNPYLPYLFNCLEDSRVDSSMFEARKGTRKMLEADTFNLLREGVPDDKGELHKSSDAPMNAQMSLATYLEAAGYQGWDAFMHPNVGRDIKDARVQQLLGEVRNATSAKEIYNLASPVLARLRELGYFLSPEEQEERDQQDEPEQDNQPEEEQQDEGDPQDESGDEGDSGDGTDPGEGDGDGEGADEPRADAGGADEGEDAPESGASAGDGAPADEAPDEPGEEGGGEGAPDGDAGAGDDAGEPGQGDGDLGAGGDDVSGDSGSGPDESGAEEAPGDAADGADQAEPESAESSDGGLTDDGADQDDVPANAGDEAADPGADGDGGAGEEPDGEGSGSAGSPVEAGDGADREADPSDSPVDGGSDPSGERNLGEGVGDPTDAEGSEAGDDGSQLDDGAGKGHDGSRPEEGSADRPGDEQHDPQEGDGDRGESADGEGDRPDEVMESGADEGKGGVEVVEEPRPRDGNEDDVKAALEHGHPHLEPGDKIMGTEEEQHAIAVAVIQGLYFETPSVGVSSVYEHQYAPDARGWDARRFDDDEKIWYGVTCDMDVSEKVLGPALLKTRRIFSDNKNSAYQPNLRSGRVNGKVLGKRAWSDDDRLFSKKRVPAKQDYAVLIMMDISSSNLGDNLALLKRSVFAQAELCQRVGIKFAIVAHSASMERVGDEAGFAMHLHHVKEWDEPWTTDIKNRVGDLVGVGGNLDGHAMEYGRKMLGKVEATDKIMMYFTDGKMPAANKEEELEVLQRQIKLAKRDRITLMGVGMRTDSPVRHGLDTVQVDDDDDLKGVVEHLGKRLARTAR